MLPHQATLYFHRTEDSRDGDIDIDEASVSEELYDGSRSLVRSSSHSVLSRSDTSISPDVFDLDM